MGLFGDILGAVTNAAGSTEGQGAQSILSNLLQQGTTGQSGAIVGQLLGAVTGGGGASGTSIQSTLETLAANGLGEHVSSWLGNASNLPVSPEQIGAALGSDQVQQMAAASGLPIGDFLKHLAEHLPAAASQAAGAPQS